MKLKENNLEIIESKGIHVPKYDRRLLKREIVHIGFGNFHRSHFLTYLDELISNGICDSGVFEVDIIPTHDSFAENFLKQDYLYSVLSLSDDGQKKLRVNGPVLGYANYVSDPNLVLQALFSKETKLITMTITEKGYCYSDDKDELDYNNPLIQHDLESSELPKTAIGLLAYVLKKRFSDDNPVTIMSCDNIPENGVKLRKCITQFCNKKYPDIVGWVDDSIAFPCTMVDRITPGTNVSDIDFLHKEYDIEDLCAVHCEDFIQWVIEDKKSTAIPDFSCAGALVVSDVKPYELMKIRLLNGAHSALSYPAYMMGIKMVDEAALNPLLKSFIRKYYMEQISPTLFPVPGVDLDMYKDKLMARFSNSYIGDSILRLASDGSKKIANAILRPLEEGIERNLNVDALILALSLWIYFFIYVDPSGKPMPIDDPKKDNLLNVANNPIEFLKVAGLSAKTASNPLLKDKLEQNMKIISSIGVTETIKNFISR